MTKPLNIELSTFNTHPVHMCGPDPFQMGQMSLSTPTKSSIQLSVPRAERIFFIRHALRAGFTLEEIFNLTKIDRWFLVQIKEIVDFEEELAGTRN